MAAFPRLWLSVSVAMSVTFWRSVPDTFACVRVAEVGLLIGSGLSGGVGGLCAISELTLCGYLNRNEFIER